MKQFNEFILERLKLNNESKIKDRNKIDFNLQYIIDHIAKNGKVGCYFIFHNEDDDEHFDMIVWEPGDPTFCHFPSKAEKDMGLNKVEQLDVYYFKNKVDYYHIPLYNTTTVISTMQDVYQMDCYLVNVAYYDKDNLFTFPYKLKKWQYTYGFKDIYKIE